MKTFFLALVFLPSLAWTQVVTDDFSDGDFTRNPYWSGDSDKFIVNALSELQLYDTGPGNSCLSTQSPGVRLWNQEWRFYIRENFSPSGNNNGRVYLVSDQANLKDSLNGYYLQFGEAGSNDAVELFRQNGNTSVSVCRGINGEIASSFTITVKVTRDSACKWSLYVDTGAGSNYQLEASGTDSLITSTGYFGVYAIYTGSDDNKFYWDDFYAGPVYVDHTLPLIFSVNNNGNSRLDLQWNEIPDSASLSQVTNYSCTRREGNPDSVVLDLFTPGLLHLYFARPFTPDLAYQLMVSGVKNRNGDAMKADTIPFWYYVPAQSDVVINEIMANPNPPVNLPPYEYIELYNRLPMPISLDNWTITVNKKTQLLQGITIAADSFLILCSPTAAAAFNASLPVYAISGFPALANAGAELTLKTDSGRVMSCVQYADTWYQDASKKNGGWSLEQIDPHNPCAGADNWKASMSPDGGTPCNRNSVNAIHPDLVAPSPVRVAVISTDTICLYFNKPLDSNSVTSTSVYRTDQHITVVAVKPVGNLYQCVLLCLSQPLQAGIIYTLYVEKGAQDCSGNIQEQEESLRFAVPQPALPEDVAINELLPDAYNGGEKYIELYNRSGKVLDFKMLDLASLDSVTGLITDIKSICADSYLFFPGDYVVLSKNGAAIKSQYHTGHPDNFIDMSSFPVMDIGGGTIALLDKNGNVIDKVTYYSSWQFPLLTSTKGVSLERVDYDRPSQDASNWHSAAETAGFGTPGDRNSEWYKGKGTATLSLNDDLFSPDDDGYQDILVINYKMDGPGYTGNMTVYDSKGSLVKLLMKNILLGTEGSINWDGTTDSRVKAAIGIYIIFLDVFSADGRRQQFKKACVLAGKL